jgi:CheY-like chemotaxis protein
VPIGWAWQPCSWPFSARARDRAPASAIRFAGQPCSALTAAAYPARIRHLPHFRRAPEAGLLSLGQNAVTPLPEARTPPVVLVAEDEPTLRSVVAACLHDEGYDVCEVANGRLALEQVRQERVDVVLADLRMPELGGRGLYEELQYFRRDLLNRFIVITGWEDADTEFFETKTAAPVIRKPFSLTALSDAVHPALTHGVMVAGDNPSENSHADFAPLPAHPGMTTSSSSPASPGAGSGPA